MANQPGVTCARHGKRVQASERGNGIEHVYNGKPCDSERFLLTERVTRGHALGVLLTEAIEARP